MSNCTCACIHKPKISAQTKSSFHHYPHNAPGKEALPCYWNLHPKEERDQPHVDPLAHAARAPMLYARAVWVLPGGLRGSCIFLHGFICKHVYIYISSIYICHPSLSHTRSLSLSVQIHTLIYVYIYIYIRIGKGQSERQESDDSWQRHACANRRSGKTIWSRD